MKILQIWQKIIRVGAQRSKVETPVAYLTGFQLEIQNSDHGADWCHRVERVSKPSQMQHVFILVEHVVIFPSQMKGSNIITQNAVVHFLTCSVSSLHVLIMSFCDPARDTEF